MRASRHWLTGSRSAVLQAAKNLKDMEATEQRFSAAMKKCSELAKGLKADKATLQAKCKQLSEDLDTARKELQV